MSGLELIEVPTQAPARAVFTTRRGGVSTGGFAGLNLGMDRDDPDERVRANRALVCDELGLDPAHVAMGCQVHGAGVREVTGADGGFLGHLREWPEGDGLVTGLPGVALVVLGADCLPVAMWRRDRLRVAAAHAGWRGLVSGVLEATVAALGEPARVGAAIGPGIGPCCYAVSAQVRTTFAQRFGEQVVSGDAVDLAAAARVALASAGVPDEAIGSVGACTSCEPERFYSYRRDGAGTGRQAAVVWAVAG